MMMMMVMVCKCWVRWCGEESCGGCGWKSEGGKVVEN